MQKTALYPGTFDPMTLGHADVICRSAALFSEVVVCIMDNPEKKPMFSLENRLEMLQCFITEKGLSNVTVKYHSGLMVNYAKQIGAAAVIRGIRNEKDFSYEATLEFFNSKLMPTLQTIYLNARPELVHLSSESVRMLIKSGANTNEFVPSCVEKTICERGMQK